MIKRYSNAGLFASPMLIGNKRFNDPVSEIVIEDKNLFVPISLGKVTVQYKDGEFYVKHDGIQTKVANYHLTKELRGISPQCLQGFLEVGYLSLKKIGDEFAIQGSLRLLGGGPISGAVGYWLTKTLCYGTAVAAATTAVVATGGAAGAATGALVAGSTASATMGASVVGGAIAGAGLAAEAATLTGATVLGAGSVAGAVAAVESASLTVGAILTAIPFLP